MKVNAYVLVADPWWLEESLRSYYDIVDRIVISYDRNGRSWTDTELPIKECLRQVERVDVDGKCDYRPGNYARNGFAPLDNETYQRQIALAQAEGGADWVLQIDTDEVVASAPTFLSCMEEADRRAAQGLEYPSRYLYTRTARGDFLESTRSLWRIRSNYPGPVAVKAGTNLRHARQADIGLFRVDFADHNLDPGHPPNAVVHRVIQADEGILHYFWVRSEEYMRRKMGWSGHSDTYSEPHRLRQWRWRTGHPVFASMFSGLCCGDWLRLTRLEEGKRYRASELDGDGGPAS